MKQNENIVIKPFVNITKLNIEDNVYEVLVWLNGGTPIDYSVITSEELLNLHKDIERLDYLKNKNFKNEPESVFEEAKKELEDFSENDKNNWRISVSISILSDNIKKDLTKELKIAITKSFNNLKL